MELSYYDDNTLAEVKKLLQQASDNYYKRCGKTPGFWNTRHAFVAIVDKRAEKFTQHEELPALLIYLFSYYITLSNGSYKKDIATALLRAFNVYSDKQQTAYDKFHAIHGENITLALADSIITICPELAPLPLFQKDQLEKPTHYCVKAIIEFGAYMDDRISGRYNGAKYRLQNWCSGVTNYFCSVNYKANTDMRLELADKMIELALQEMMLGMQHWVKHHKDHTSYERALQQRCLQLLLHVQPLTEEEFRDHKISLRDNHSASELYRTILEPFEKSRVQGLIDAATSYRTADFSFPPTRENTFT